MEQWKIDIADNMVSWDFPATREKWYGIRITSNSDSSREKCEKAISANIGKLSTDYKKMESYGHVLCVHVGSEEAEDELKANLNRVYSEVAAARQKEGERESPVVEKKIERQNYSALLIFVALIAALVWVILVWKPKK